MMKPARMRRQCDGMDGATRADGTRGTEFRWLCLSSSLHLLAFYTLPLLPRPPLVLLRLIIAFTQTTQAKQTINIASSNPPILLFRRWDAGGIDRGTGTRHDRKL